MDRDNEFLEIGFGAGYRLAVRDIVNVLKGALYGGKGLDFLPGLIVDLEKTGPPKRIIFPANSERSEQ